MMDDPDLREVEDLKLDINILNLLNVLYLTPQQIDGLLDLHERRRELTVQVKGDLIGNAEDTKQAFRALRHALIAKDHSDDRVSKLAQRANSGMKDIGFEAIKQFNDLVEEAENILNDSQRVIIEHYKSCIIPPKNEINPLRVGQSSDDGHKKQLERVRKMSDEQYASRKDSIDDRMYGRVKKLVGGRPGVSLEGVRDTIVETLDKARSMSETEFRLYEENPVKDMLKKKLGKKDTSPIRPKIQRFILHPNAELLLRRIKDR